jgi:CRISPR-associated endonuclease/helicase Cas3
LSAASSGEFNPKRLIEAGVDVDFSSVIRIMAGLDSIAQAAGRCNRNGKRDTGNVYVINIQNENLDRLPDIKIGRECAEFVFRNLQKGYNLIGPEAIDLYFQKYFFERKEEMSYPINKEQIGYSNAYVNLLEILSENKLAVNEYQKKNNEYPDLFLRQSFMTAAKIFEAIDSPSEAIIVPYKKEGKTVINKLLSSSNYRDLYVLLKEAQQYSINIFPCEKEKLLKEKALRLIKELDVFYLDPRYYSERYGLSFEPLEEAPEEYYV